MNDVYAVLGQPINYFPWPTTYTVTPHPPPGAININFVPTPIDVPHEDTPFGGKPVDKTAPPPKDPVPVVPVTPAPAKKTDWFWPGVALGVGGVALFVILS